MWALSNRWSQIKPWLVCEMKFMFAPSAPLLPQRAKHIPGCVLPEGNSLYGYAMVVAYKWTFIISRFSRGPLSSQQNGDGEKRCYTTGNNSESKMCPGKKHLMDIFTFKWLQMKNHKPQTLLTANICYFFPETRASSPSCSRQLTYLSPIMMMKLPN